MKPLTDRGCQTGARAIALVVATLTLVPLSPVAAAPAGGKSKVVQALISAAQKEFDAGNFERAGELFLEIWRQDPEARPILYNAARAYQLAGKVDKADELFRELLAIADLDPVLKGKAQTQLEGLQVKRSEHKADEAGRAEKAGQYALAAGLWAEAIKLQPKKIAWLIKQARAYHLAGQLQQALATYDKYLAAAPANAEDRAQVQTWRDECVARPPVASDPPVEKPVEKPVEAPVAPPPERPAEPAAVVTPTTAATAMPTATPAKPPARSAEPKPAPPPPAPSKTPLLVLGISGAVLAGGAVVLVSASGDKADLDAAQAKKDASGKVIGISHADATKEASRIQTNFATGWAMTGLGLVGAGVGAWLWMHQPSAPVAVAPVPDGLVIVGRF